MSENRRLQGGDFLTYTVHSIDSMCMYVYDFSCRNWLLFLIAVYLTKILRCAAMSFVNQLTIIVRKYFKLRS